MTLNEYVIEHRGRSIAELSDRELYEALLCMTREAAQAKAGAVPSGKKKLYYLSAEFLIGRLLTNNLINLGMYDSVRSELAACGRDIAALEEMEPEPSLGNGGLGRLAACFLDSIATLGLNGDGIGLNYHLGLFKQVFENNLQQEKGDSWIDSPTWLTKREVSYPVQFGNLTVRSRLYDIAVTGYESRTNQLHLFDLDSVDETIVTEGIHFDKSDIEKNLTLFLYPDDSDEEGRLLRVFQQYFLVSNAARYILDECTARGCALRDLYDYAVIQINDTHPTMVIPELIRLLTERGIETDEAIDIVSRTCAYTNHTILAEALEKWPIRYLKKVVPQLVPVIELLDDRVRRRFHDESLAIIDRQDQVHMAHIDIHYGFSVNGVAYLHTEILKSTELNRFYRIYPEKFNNKTNGITFRRWLLKCNPLLTGWIESRIGDGFKRDARELTKLTAFLDDREALGELLAVKRLNRRALKQYLKEDRAIEIDERSILDVQIKRLHEYKRQQMNALYVIRKYLEIKAGKLPRRPVTVIFGAKAAPAYVTAKDIIHLILCLSRLVNGDPQVSPHMKVIMVENYNVTLAEKLIPACDISEQISLASREASGTGNMKLMLNGAVTLGTLDGANVEIAQLVGMDNIYIFGETSEQVICHYAKGDYSPRTVYEANPMIREAVDFLVSPRMLQIGREENLKRLYNELLSKDWFMTLLDLEEYIRARDRVYEDFEDRLGWARKMLVNISHAGYFSSDRTVEEYNRDIWRL